MDFLRGNMVPMLKIRLYEKIVVRLYAVLFVRAQLANVLDFTSSNVDSGNGLCVFVWESSFIDPNTRPCTVLAFFDINQWYLAQMPSKIRFVHLL